MYRNWTLITKITFKTATRKENECLKNHENPNNSKITPLKIVKASQSSINSIRMEITQHSKHVHFAFNSNCAADAPKTRLAFSIVEGWEHQPFQAFHWVFFFREKFYAKLIVRRQKKLSRFVCHKLTNSQTQNCSSGYASGRKLINCDKGLYSINPISRIILVAWISFWMAIWQRLIWLDESLF